MVKMSETIICQRFIQNAWKKDLCSNCFKSKEDHVVLPEKKINYKWTSHVNNFPQQSILKDGRKNGKEKLRSVSFRTNESEIIGFGGEEYSSDDEFHLVQSEDITTEIDNEDEDREFRKLTQCNTDFNSVTANLKTNEVSSDTYIRNVYSDLQLGKPQVDAEGRRQTLHVIVEPFKNSNGVIAIDSKIHSNKIINSCSNIEKTDIKNNKYDNTDTINKESKNTGNDNYVVNDDDIKDRINSSIMNEGNNSSDASNTVNDNVKNSIDENKNAHVESFIYRDTLKHSQNHVTIVCDTKTATAQNNLKILDINSGLILEQEMNDIENDNSRNEMCIVDDEKYLRVSNILVNITKNDEAGFDYKTKTIDDVTYAKTKYESLDNKTAKFTICETAENETNSNRDHNSVSLPLITSKDLEIEYDKPGSRELVGEPDGKADSDDSSDPLVSADECDRNRKMTFSQSSPYVNPQRSFLHGSNTDKPAPAVKPVILAATINITPKKLTALKDLPENTVRQITTQCTPKLQQPMSNCNSNGSTKRPAPKPPSPKLECSSRMLTAPALVQKSQAFVSVNNGNGDDSAKTCDSPLLDEMKDTVCFLTSDQNTNSIKRKLNLDSVIHPNQNSLNVCVSVNPNKTNSLQGYLGVNGLNDDFDTASITSIEQSRNMSNNIKCSRSLSCDSIISPNGLTLSEKSRKYTAATVRVKSTIRRFLRFNSKEDEKIEAESRIQPIAPRRRIEIIHPLDLNKSSIEILRSTITSSNDSTNGDSDVKKSKSNENEDRVSAVTNITHTSPGGRPTKPPPPPRTQSLDQKFSEISKPVRPPPPKSVNLKPLQSRYTNIKTSSNAYENIGESRHGTAPAKPQRVSSMRDRSRQSTVTIPNTEENVVSLLSECEIVPECDQNRQQLSNLPCDSPSLSSVTYCGSETESDICFRLLGSHDCNSSNSEFSNIVLRESKQRKNKSVMHISLEDNYGAVVVANYEALSQLLERVNEATVIPNSLKRLQTALHVQFDHLTIIEDSKVTVADWHFYNAMWFSQNIVISISAKHLAPLRSLPSFVTLYPLIKFTDMVPINLLKSGSSNEEKVNACITIWNEERIESITSYCTKLKNTAVFNECGLLFTQLTNAIKHLQACGVEDISLDEIFICKRESEVESKLVLLPFNVDSITSVSKDDNRTKISLCECVSTVLDLLLPKQRITKIIKLVLSDEKATSLSQTKAVTEYWLWGPDDVTFAKDRQISLQRWLDLERANYLHKMVCKQPGELSLRERCHMMFLVRTNAKILTDASYLLERLT